MIWPSTNGRSRSPLWFLVALLIMIGDAPSAAASNGPEKRVRAIPTVTVDSVAASSSESPASVGCLRPSNAAMAVGACVATEAVSSRAARRQSMRDAGIPTSQQPVSQTRNASGYEYSYDVPSPGGGSQRMSVQQQTLDRSHVGQPHWEAGTVKVDPLTGQVRLNNYGRPALTNDKAKVDYEG